jgi:hypothetical protein
METMIKINDCGELKNELHNQLYVKSSTKNFDEYIEYINSIYSNNKTSFEKINIKEPSIK